MVKIMIKLLKNISLLRIEAPEWYPSGWESEMENEDETTRENKADKNNGY